MTPLQEERLNNAICFFAKEHKLKSGKYLYQTALYKYIALLEFEILKNEGVIIFGLNYKAMKRGPVPLEIYGGKDDNEFYKFKQDEKSIGQTTYYIRYLKECDLGLFLPRDISFMKDLIRKFASYYLSTKEISDHSHEKIKAWKLAYEREPNSIMKMEDTFDDSMTEQKDRFEIEKHIFS